MAEAQIPSSSGNEWKTISLPFRPMDLTSSGNKLWVCGSNEMIATSSDGGESWQVKRQKPDGEVLTRIGFVEEKIGYAAGTHGLLLWTRAGGESWTESRSDTETIRDIAFSNEKDGLRTINSAVEMTADGGKTWSPIRAYQQNKELEQFSTVAALAILDDRRAAILYRSGKNNGHLLVSTENAGKTWSVSVIPDASIWGLTAHANEFWIFGYQVIEKDKPGGGYSVALAMHSSDGSNWSRGVRAPSEFSDCNPQGCILWDGAIVELFHEKTNYYGVPAAGKLTPVWVSAQGGLCSVSVSLNCTTATKLDAPPAKQSANRPSSGSIDPFLRGPELPSADCLRCRLSAFPIDKKLLGQLPVGVILPGGREQTMTMPGLKSSLEIEYVVRKDGSNEQVRVKHAPNKQIEAAVTESVQGWVMVPKRLNGAPTEEKRKGTINVSCQAFPSNDEALCTLHAL